MEAEDREHDKLVVRGIVKLSSFQSDAGCHGENVEDIVRENLSLVGFEGAGVVVRRRRVVSVIVRGPGGEMIVSI